MANANTNIDLAELHQAIGDAISAQFPDFKLVEFYREEDDRKRPNALQLPACLLELSEMEPALDEDPGTEQLAVYARFAAHVVIGFRTASAKVEIRKLAGALAAYINKEKHFHKLPTGPAEILSIMPNEFNPAMDAYEVWTVEWRCMVHLGDTVWTDEGVTPGAPLYSWVPDIGNGNAHKYQPTIPDIGLPGEVFP